MLTLIKFIHIFSMPHPDNIGGELPDHFFVEDDNEFALGIVERQQIIDEFFQ